MPEAPVMEKVVLKSKDQSAAIPTIIGWAAAQMYWSEGPDFDLMIFGKKADGSPFACYTNLLGGALGVLDADGYQHAGDTGVDRGVEATGEDDEEVKFTAEFLKTMEILHVVIVNYTGAKAKDGTSFGAYKVRFEMSVDGTTVIEAKLDNPLPGHYAHVVDIIGGESPTVKKVDAVLSKEQYEALPGPPPVLAR